MTIRMPVRAVAVLAGAVGVTGVATGSVAGVPTPADRSDARAVATLERAAGANRTVAYSGVQSVTQWSAGAAASLVVHVVHVPGVGLLARPARTADGPGHGALFDDGERREADLSVTADEVALLRENYRLAMEPVARVDGRVADVVGAYRPSGSAAARFWVDHATGLVLRRELLDGQGRLARVTTFLDVTVLRTAPQLPMGSVKAMRRASGRALDADAVAAQTRAGFRAPYLLPTGHHMVDARLLTTGSGEVLHLTYCDGLTTLSMFEQRGRIGHDRLRGWQDADMSGHVVLRARGMPERIAWSARGVVFTLVGDAPDDVLTDVVRAWPRADHPGGGLMQRLHRGFARIGSWIDPFA